MKTVNGCKLYTLLKRRMLFKDCFSSVSSLCMKLFRKGTHNVVNISLCLVQPIPNIFHSSLNQLLEVWSELYVRLWAEHERLVKAGNLQLIITCRSAFSSVIFSHFQTGLFLNVVQLKKLFIAKRSNFSSSLLSLAHSRSLNIDIALEKFCRLDWQWFKKTYCLKENWKFFLGYYPTLKIFFQCFPDNNRRTHQK